MPVKVFMSILPKYSIVETELSNETLIILLAIFCKMFIRSFSLQLMIVYLLCWNALGLHR